MRDLLTDGRLGFAIVCSDCNVASLRSTVNSVRMEFPRSVYVAVVPDKSTASEVAEMARHCKVIRGRGTVTSLISEGVKGVDAEWVLVVVSGGYVRYSAIKKYVCFLESDKDVLYPVVDRKYIFSDASVSGILVKRETFLTVGDFPEWESLSESKLYWASDAMDNGCQFKAIVGAHFI